MSLNLLLMASRLIAVQTLPPPVYDAPLVINDALISARGSNIFEGNWEQANFADNHTGNGYGAAIVLATANPVVIRNSRIKAQCYGIQWSVINSQLTLENCVIECKNTQSAGKSAQRALNILRPRSLTVEHCTLIGGGIQLSETPSTGSFVRIRYNRALNIDGRKSDGAGGYVFEASNSTAYFEAKQFLQLRDGIVVADGEVSWNEIINDPFVSRREDAINIFGGSGVSAKPFSIHDNCIKGGHPTRPYDIGYSGAGFLVEDAGATASYVDIDDNHVIGAGNCAMNLVGGGVSHIRARRNRFVSCGRVNGVNVHSSAMNSPVNVYGGTGPTYVELIDTGYSWRNSATAVQKDIWFDAIGNVGNSETGSYVIGTPTDEAMEAAEWAAWVAKKAAAGVVVGSALAA